SIQLINMLKSEFFLEFVQISARNASIQVDKWANIETQRKYFDWLGNRLQLNSPEDWYKVHLYISHSFQFSSLKFACRFHYKNILKMMAESSLYHIMEDLDGRLND